MSDLNGFEVCDEVPRSSQARGYADAIREFYESGNEVMRRKIESSSSLYSIGSSYKSAAHRLKLPVAVHIRRPYIYLERTDKE